MFKEADEEYLWDKDAPSQEILEQSLTSRDELFVYFRDQWYRSYLLSLREHCRDLHQCNWSNRIRAGDVVLIKTPNKSRPYWLLGRVLELVVGHDNVVRSVRLKRGDGIIVHHSINHLYPLELSLTHAHRDAVGNQSEINQDSEDDNPLNSQSDDNHVDHPSDLGQNEIDQNNEEVKDTNVRPKRQAASACRQKLRRWCTQLNQ